MKNNAASRTAKFLGSVDQFPYLLARWRNDLLLITRRQFHAPSRIVPKKAALDRARALLAHKHHAQTDDHVVDSFSGYFFGKIVHEVLDLVVANFGQVHFSEMGNETRATTGTVE